MTEDPDRRRQHVIMYEGQALNFAGVHGQDVGIYNARCCIDGAMNALVRMVGPEEAARYAFALADRVVGGVRAPTEFPPAKVTIAGPAGPPPIEIKPVPDPKPQTAGRMRFFAIFIVGWLCGFSTAWSAR